MGIFGHKNHDEHLFCFDQVTIVTQKIQYSQNPCDYDECPFKAIEGKEYCDIHQKEYENTLAGRQPDEDEN